MQKGRRGGKDGENQSSQAQGKAARETDFSQRPDQDPRLKDLTPEERAAWGRINDRDVAQSLRALWDKIPRSYRVIVSQYFREITDPEPEKAAGPAEKR
ncbi:MAG: hypothetical protein HY721_26280 [Planctomycetes bacterium]|nr:hypothetical protein [Planctomycetota bacterium]